MQLEPDRFESLRGPTTTTIKHIVPETFPALRPYYVSPNVFHPTEFTSTEELVNGADVPRHAAAKMTVKT